MIVKSFSPIQSGTTYIETNSELFAGTEYFFSDDNSRLYCLITRRNCFEANNNYYLLGYLRLDGYGNGTDYDYRIDLSNFIMNPHYDVSVSEIDNFYSFVMPSNCNVFNVMFSTNDMLSDTGFTQYVSGYTNGILYIEDSSKASADAYCYSSFSLEVVDNDFDLENYGYASELHNCSDFVLAGNINTIVDPNYLGCLPISGEDIYYDEDSPCNLPIKVGYILRTETGDFTTAYMLFSGSDCQTFANAGYYIQNNYWRYWDGLSFTSDGHCESIYNYYFADILECANGCIYAGGSFNVKSEDTLIVGKYYRAIVVNNVQFLALITSEGGDGSDLYISGSTYYNDCSTACPTTTTTTTLSGGTTTTTTTTLASTTTTTTLASTTTTTTTSNFSINVYNELYCQTNGYIGAASNYITSPAYVDVFYQEYGFIYSTQSGVNMSNYTGISVEGSNEVHTYWWGAGNSSMVYSGGIVYYSKAYAIISGITYLSNEYSISCLPATTTTTTTPAPTTTTTTTPAPTTTTTTTNVESGSGGTVYTAFNTTNGFNNDVYSIAIQTDKKILAAGEFTSYSGVTYNRIIRLNSGGTIDTSFNIGTGFDNIVTSLNIQTDNKILVGGYINSYSGITGNYLIRLNSGGTKDTSFSTSISNLVLCTAIQNDGKILVGGAGNFVRLNSGGTTDTSFNVGTGFNDAVRAIHVQNDGKILVGGSFTSYNGSSYNKIIRLNSGGTIDTSFNIGVGISGTSFNNTVYAIEVQDDGKILVGGSFITYSGTTVNRIVRLNSGGTIDTSFNTGSGFNVSTFSIKVQSNGKILVGGSFTSYNGSSYNELIRLNSDGSIDTSFVVGTGFNTPATAVRTIEFNNPQKIVVGGEFASYNGTTAGRIIGIYI